MNLLLRVDRLYQEYKGNKWLHYFTIFCRVALALGFIPSGVVKVMGDQRQSKIPSDDN